MPRGRHRHSPPLHRLLPPSAIAGVSLVCAFGPWVFTQQAVLRVVAAAAAATAVVGAAVMRRWDTQAGKQVADLTRARASDEWRHEERVAELETDLEESRELRVKLEQRLRAKRAELAGLRNEHAALLRRYATAETERASALEGRRLLEIEAGPTQALPPVPGEDAADAEADAGIETAESGAAESEAAESDAAQTGAVAASADAAEAGDTAGDEEAAEGPAVFSPQGSQLFLRAKAALKRFDEDEDDAAEDAAAEDGASATDDPSEDASEEAVPAQDASPGDDPANAGRANDDSPADDPTAGDAPSGDSAAAEDGPAPGDDGAPEDDGSPKGDGPGGDRSRRRERVVKAKAAAATSGASASAPEPAPTAPEAAVDGGTEAAAQPGAAREDEAQGQPVAVDGHGHAAATTPARQTSSVQRPAGHFVAPTAVAVVPTTPTRRPAVEGGFDFFGTKTEPSPKAMEAVQNEDLADVVGEEALALHKAEAEAEFKPADEEARGDGQVIDLTAHDETEQIDLQGLRSAVS